MNLTQKFKGASRVSSEMKCAVTGGAGFIGNHVVRYLIEQNHSVIVIDNLNNGRIENLKDIQNKIDFYKVDILNYDKMKQIVDGIDCIFHHEALTSLT